MTARWFTRRRLMRWKKARMKMNKKLKEAAKYLESLASKPKHTLGPWEVVEPPTRDHSYGVRAIGEKAHVALVQSGDAPWSSGKREANAARIVACVNACEGI